MGTVGLHSMSLMLPLSIPLTLWILTDREQAALRSNHTSSTLVDLTRLDVNAQAAQAATAAAKEEAEAAQQEQEAAQRQHQEALAALADQKTLQERK